MKLLLLVLTASLTMSQPRKPTVYDYFDYLEIPKAKREVYDRADILPPQHRSGDVPREDFGPPRVPLEHRRQPQVSPLRNLQPSKPRQSQGTSLVRGPAYLPISSKPQRQEAQYIQYKPLTVQQAKNRPLYHKPKISYIPEYQQVEGPLEYTDELFTYTDKPAYLQNPKRKESVQYPSQFSKNKQRHVDYQQQKQQYQKPQKPQQPKHESKYEETPPPEFYEMNEDEYKAAAKDELIKEKRQAQVATYDTSLQDEEVIGASSSHAASQFPSDAASVQDARGAGRLTFQIHGQQGPHSYRFGYDTGKGPSRQFRYEEKDGKGEVHGRYGHYDEHGKLQVVNYSAHPEHGFSADVPH